MKRCESCGRIVLFAKSLENALCSSCRKKRSVLANDACKALWERISRIKYSNDSPEIRFEHLRSIAAEFGRLIYEYGSLIDNDGARIKAQLKEEIILAEKEISFLHKKSSEGDGFAARLKREIVAAQQVVKQDEVERKPVSPQYSDTAFEVLYQRPTLDDMRPATLSFPIDELEHVMMSGVRRRFDSENLENKGTCEDSRYCCFENQDITLWVKNNDLRDFIGNILYRCEKLAAVRREQLLARQEQLAVPLSFDQPSEALFNCFIAFGPKANDDIANMKKLIEALSAVCAENDGRFYKTPAKSAKSAIIFSPDAYINDNILELRSKGYSVFAFVDALKFFSLRHLWNLDNYAVQVEQFRHSLDDITDDISD